MTLFVRCLAALLSVREITCGCLFAYVVVADVVAIVYDVILGCFALPLSISSCQRFRVSVVDESPIL